MTHTAEEGRPAVPPTHHRERPAERAEWSRIRRHLKVRTMWGLPFRLFLVAVGLGLVLPLVDLAAGRLLDSTSLFSSFPSLGLDSGMLAGILGTVAGAMITLTGLVFSALTAAMSFGITSLSVRIVPVFQSDLVIRWGIGLFAATFVYALLVALSLVVAPDGFQPWLAAGVAVAATLACGVLFIAVVARVCQFLDSPVLLRQIARSGFRALRFDPAPFHHGAAHVTDREISAPQEITRQANLRDGTTLLAVNTRRLIDLEQDWGITIEVVPKVGTSVQHGGLLFRVGAPLSSRGREALLGCLAFGESLSPESGPFGALRAISDIALKALSPAVNDPTRAVQALDHIEDILAEVSPRLAARDISELSAQEEQVLRAWSRSWEDFVAVATDEIRQFGSTSIQVQRRLRAVYASLLEQCATAQHAALRTRLDALDRQIRTAWSDPLDLRLSAEADPEGIGTVAAANSTDS